MRKQKWTLENPKKKKKWKLNKWRASYFYLKQGNYKVEN